MRARVWPRPGDQGSLPHFALIHVKQQLKDETFGWALVCHCGGDGNSFFLRLGRQLEMWQGWRGACFRESEPQVAPSAGTLCHPEACGVLAWRPCLVWGVCALLRIHLKLD